MEVASRSTTAIRLAVERKNRFYNRSPRNNFTLNAVTRSVRVPVSGDRSVCRLKHLRWFPIDNNLLSGATLDGRLMVYEGGSLVPVESFSLPKGVIINDQSLCQSSKMLAAATSHGLRLFDLRSGSNIHNLMRKRSAFLLINSFPLRWSFDSTHGLGHPSTPRPFCGR